MLSRRDVDADGEGDVPPTLQDLLMVRLDELGPDRALAQLVSVLGRECSAIHLGALLEQDDPFVERARQQGSLASLLYSGQLQTVDGPLPGYRFKHALIRDVAYGSIWTDDRTRLHGLCADLIERITPELLQQRPEQLAYHLEAAGRHEPAQRAWLAAAQLAATRQAHYETVELAQRALALYEHLTDGPDHARGAMQLHLLVASAQIALQGYGSAAVEVAYQAAERAGNQLTDTAHALRIRLGLEACYVMRGDLRRAAELAQAGVAATEWEKDARLALQSRWALANVRFHQGDWHAALAGFDDCLAHYRLELHRRNSVQDPAIMCLGYSSWIHFELGQADEALHRIVRMLELAEQLQHPFSTGVALGFAASLKRLCGDTDGAWPHAVEAVRVCERGGFQVWLAHAWMVRGQLLSDRGDVQGGAEDMDRGYGQWVGGGARISCATYLATRAELLLRQGETQRAASALDEAWHISEQIGEHYYQPELLRLQGLCAWQARDALRAEQTLGQALDLAERQLKPGLALRCALSLGALQAAQGRWQEPVRRLRILLTQVPQHGSCRDARWARYALQCWKAGQACDSLPHTPWEPR
jgi:tetratricopeptide (TPR) repeat protein